MAIKENAKLSKTSSKNGGTINFFREVKSEIKRISWPSKNDTKKALIAVGVVGLMYLILVGGLDYISQYLFEFILKLK